MAVHAAGHLMPSAWCRARGAGRVMPGAW